MEWLHSRFRLPSAFRLGTDWGCRFDFAHTMDADISKPFELNSLRLPHRNWLGEYIELDRNDWLILDSPLGSQLSLDN